MEVFESVGIFRDYRLGLELTFNFDEFHVHLSREVIKLETEFRVDFEDVEHKGGKVII